MNDIMLVEDDTMIASGILYALETEGYEVCHAATVADAHDFIKKREFHLAIIDMQLPDGTGFAVSEKLEYANTAVIFLTVVDDENTIVKAFDDGAADYIVKPFRIRELLARVRRVLSIQNKQTGKDNIICIGQVRINTDEAKNKGVLLSRQQILDKIWDIDGNFVEDNTLTVYVKRLREKLGEAINIETVRGMGYRVD